MLERNPIFGNISQSSLILYQIKIKPIASSHGLSCALLKQEQKCPIDAHCHRHCRRDPRITKDCIKFLQVLSFWVGKKFLRKVSRRKLWSSKLAELLCNPWISSAMAMAMSIYRTPCVLVFFLNPRDAHWPSTTSWWPPLTPPWPHTDLPGLIAHCFWQWASKKGQIWGIWWPRTLCDTLHVCAH